MPKDRKEGKTNVTIPRIALGLPPDVISKEQATLLTQAATAVAPQEYVGLVLLDRMH